MTEAGKDGDDEGNWLIVVPRQRCFGKGDRDGGHTSANRGPSLAFTPLPCPPGSCHQLQRTPCSWLDLLHATTTMAGLLEQLDAAISGLLMGWNMYTTLIVSGIIGYLFWIVYDSADADTHPLLLARQAQASYVRQPGESAIFRSPETPHGCRSTPHVLTAYATDMCQIRFVPDSLYGQPAPPCTRPARTEIFETSGSV